VVDFFTDTAKHARAARNINKELALQRAVARQGCCCIWFPSSLGKAGSGYSKLFSVPFLLFFIWFNKLLSLWWMQLLNFHSLGEATTVSGFFYFLESLAATSRRKEVENASSICFAVGPFSRFHPLYICRQGFSICILFRVSYDLLIRLALQSIQVQ
jgi:hypothetical protein